MTTQMEKRIAELKMDGYAGRTRCNVFVDNKQ
jgi:hypothetical protein